MSGDAPPLLAALRTRTAARIGLGHTGTSLPTAAQLDFQLAHARARDAVHAPLDVALLIAALAARGLRALHLRSAAADRPIYLRRPDLGRRLDAGSRAQLQTAMADDTARPNGTRADGTRPRARIGLVLADGLSARAIHDNALPLLDAWLPLAAQEDWQLLTPVIVEQGRVAVADEIGELQGADLVAILIGERPGLSAADSLGIYLTFAPRIGLKDASRNCISNIRPAGLQAGDAARTLHYLVREALRRRLSGVMLKDETALPMHPDRTLADVVPSDRDDEPGIGP